MTDATLPTPQAPRSSLLYAMGKLEAQVAAHAETVRELPGRILEALAPQLLEVNTKLVDHEGRLRGLERSRWVVYGGGAILVTLAGWYAEMHHG